MKNRVFATVVLIILCLPLSAVTRTGDSPLRFSDGIAKVVRAIKGLRPSMPRIFGDFPAPPLPRKDCPTSPCPCDPATQTCPTGSAPVQTTT